MSSTITDADLIVNVDSLRAGNLGAMPINVPGWDVPDEDDDYCYYEAAPGFNVSTGERLVRIVKSGAVEVVAVPHLGRSYSEFEYDEYLSDSVDHDAEAAHMDEGDWGRWFLSDPADIGDTGPMMNYWYPCPAVEDDPANAAYILREIPVCVVQRDGNWGLALTGGGQDLTWEIVEAYVRLGELPPTHFCDLPGMAGRGRITRDHVLIRACLRSLEVAARRLRDDHERLVDRAGFWSDGAFTP